MWLILDEKDNKYKGYAKNMEEAKEMVSIRTFTNKKHILPIEIKEIKIEFESGEYCRRIYKNLWVLFNKDGKQLLIDSLDNCEMSLDDCARSKIVYENGLYAIWKDKIEDEIYQSL